MSNKPSSFDQIVKNEEKRFDDFKSPVKMEEKKDDEEVSAAEAELDELFDVNIEDEPEVEKVGKHIYLDEDIANILDKLGSRRGRSRSEIVNQTLKTEFIRRGLIKED